ncbi:MAG: hypothetical protein GEU73_08240 [Chloroflexi bacterium]|nr:hypothetical protein [Chloroflexota bacterium]
MCEPHDAFKNPATIDESLFAATLGGVHAGAARSEYREPDIFLSHTYFTENLTQTIRDVDSRLAGGQGPAVIEMQTPFGGGKTHALLALYHLIRDPQQALAIPAVREALYDPTVFSAEYLAAQVAAYPLHPELVMEGNSSIMAIYL